MKKITFLIAHLGNGGAERVTVTLANYFSHKGYSVSVIVFNRDLQEYVLDSNIKVDYLSDYGDKVYLRILALRKILYKNSPEYVITLGFGYRYLFLGGLLNKYNYIFSERNAPQFEYKTSLMRKYISYCFSKAKGIVFQTRDAQLFYNEKIINKSIIIPNPLKSKLPKPYIGKREKRIVAFSRLNEQKNIPMMLNSFKIFLNTFPKYNLDIYGRGPLESDLKEYTKKIGIANSVNFKGFSDKIHEDILKATMFVSSSNFEGISNSMLEALALGLPCVCTDCPAGGAKMFIKDGINGYLVKVNDELDMANAMIKVCSNEKNIEILSQNATKVRSELNVDFICEKWKNFIESLN